MTEPPDVTRLLNGRGQPAADLLPMVYNELRRLAQHRMNAERPGHTLSATALVHEAYAKLASDRASDRTSPGPGPGPTAGQAELWRDRGHFFAAAAEAMRRILIDHARARLTLKRGGAPADGSVGGPARGPAGGRAHHAMDLDAVAASVGESPADLLDLDAAMDALGREDGRKAELVRLRFYAGLTLEQAAAVMGISPATADRWWKYARAWLLDRLRSAEADEGPAAP